VPDIPVTADPGETPAGTADAAMAVDPTAARGVAEAEVPPELLAQSLGQYLRASWLRVRSGNSGVLPVVLAIVVVAVSFQIANPKFLSAQNLVNLFEQSSVYMVLAMAEIFALLLGEIDLSVGLVHGVWQRRGRRACAADRRQLAMVGPAIIAALLACSAVGAIQGSLVARLKMAVVHSHSRRLLILEGWRSSSSVGARQHRQLPVPQPGSSSTTSSGGGSTRWPAGSAGRGGRSRRHLALAAGRPQALVTAWRPRRAASRR